MQKKKVLALIAALILLQISATISEKRHSQGDILVNINSHTMSLQEAISNDYLTDEATPSSDGVTSLAAGHSADEIFLNVRGKQMSLAQAITSYHLCGNGLYSYTEPLGLVGHSADEIEVTINSNTKTLQDAINEKDFCTYFYSEWSAWDECSVTCGGGTQARTRECIESQTEAIVDCDSCGNICSGTQDCNTQSCCGNGICGTDETCSNCASDCGKCNGASCSSGTECASTYCVHSVCRISDPYCNDDYCDAGEDCSSCDNDCGNCNGELCLLDSQCASGNCVHFVCRESGTYCGDGYCDTGEGCASCVDDCGKCNGASCSSGTECASTYCVHSVCRSSDPYCNDDYCDAGEDCSSCDNDCGCSSGYICSSGSCVVACTNHSYSQCSGGDRYWYDSCNNKQDLREDCTYGCSGDTCLAYCDSNRCGDGTCNCGETCSTCSSDCGCDSYQTCSSGSCITTVYSCTATVANQEWMRCTVESYLATCKAQAKYQDSKWYIRFVDSGGACVGSLNKDWTQTTSLTSTGVAYPNYGGKCVATISGGNLNVNAYYSYSYSCGEWCCPCNEIGDCYYLDTCYDEFTNSCSTSL